MRIGVDLGGTKTEALALDDSGHELRRVRVPTPQQDYLGTVRTIAALVQGLEREIGARGTVGVGIPGTITAATGLVKNANSTWLNGQPLQRDLSDALSREVRCANDANCFAISEATDGAAVGAEVVFGVILGTGCGGGIVVRGALLTGPNGLAGEWGTPRCPGQTPTNGPARNATADAAAVSRPGYPAQPSSATLSAPPAARCAARRLSPHPLRGMPRQTSRSSASRIVSPVAFRPSSISSIPMSLC
jgi:predicted NBD/HSP70 family sugar kinase